VRDLFVPNISYDASELDLRALFETVGVVSKVKLIFSRTDDPAGSHSSRSMTTMPNARLRSSTATFGVAGSSTSSWRNCASTEHDGQNLGNVTPPSRWSPPARVNSFARECGTCGNIVGSLPGGCAPIGDAPSAPPRTGYSLCDV